MKPLGQELQGLLGDPLGRIQTQRVAVVRRDWMKLAAEQPRQRKPRCAGQGIPQGDVQSGHGDGREPLAADQREAGVELLRDRHRRHGVASDHL